MHRQHPVLTKLSFQAVTSILRKGKLLTLEPNQEVYSKGDTKKKFYMVMFGTLELYRPAVIEE